jgi:hypothetical protein
MKLQTNKSTKNIKLKDNNKHIKNKFPESDHPE